MRSHSDITDRSAIAALPDALPAELNGVVNNAGIVVNGPVEGLALDDLTKTVHDVNVIPQIAVTQAVLPKIRQARGGGRLLGQWAVHHTRHWRLQRTEICDRVPGRRTLNRVAP